MPEILIEEELSIRGNAGKFFLKTRLEKFLRENNIKFFTESDFDFPKDKKTQAKTRAEVDEFLEMREQWRGEDLKSEKEDNKWLS